MSRLYRPIGRVLAARNLAQPRPDLVWVARHLVHPRPH